MAHVKERSKERGRKRDPRNRPVTAGKRAVCSMHEGEAGGFSTPPTPPPHVQSVYASAGPFTMKAKLMPIFRDSAFGRTHGLFAWSEWQQLLFPQSWLTEHFWNTDCQDCWHIGHVEWKRAFKKESVDYNNRPTHSVLLVNVKFDSLASHSQQRLLFLGCSPWKTMLFV